MTKDDAMKKIEKLLSFDRKGAATESERKDAMLKAQRIAAKFNLDMQDSINKENVQDIEIFTVNDRWKGLLAKVVAMNFRCRSYRAYNTKTRRFIGYPEDIEIARRILLFAILDIDYQFNQSFGDRFKSIKEKRSYKKTFAYGYIEGLKENFEKNLRQMEQETKGAGLVMVIPHEVDERTIRLGLEPSKKDTYAVNDLIYSVGVKRGNEFNTDLNKKLKG